MRRRVQALRKGEVCTAQKETETVCRLQAWLSIAGLNLRKPLGQADSRQKQPRNTGCPGR